MNRCPCVSETLRREVLPFSVPYSRFMFYKTEERHKLFSANHRPASYPIVLIYVMIEEEKERKRKKENEFSDKCVENSDMADPHRILKLSPDS